MESLLLSCRALSSPTTCRFIPAHSVPPCCRRTCRRVGQALSPANRFFHRSSGSGSCRCIPRAPSETPVPAQRPALAFREENRRQGTGGGEHPQALTAGFPGLQQKVLEEDHPQEAEAPPPPADRRAAR